MRRILILTIIITNILFGQLWQDSTAGRPAVYHADSICTYYMSIFDTSADSCVNIFTMIAAQNCSIYIKPDTYTTEGWVACGETAHIDTTDLTGGGSDTCEHWLYIVRMLGQGSNDTDSVNTCKNGTLTVVDDTCNHELTITRGGNSYDDIYICNDGNFDIPYDSIYIKYDTSWSSEGYITHLDSLKIDTSKFVDTCEHKFYTYSYDWFAGNYKTDSINTCTPETLDLTTTFPIYEPLIFTGSADASTLKVKYDDLTITLNNSDELSIKDGGVTTGKLADGAVTSTKIYDGTIIKNDIATGQIDSLRLADNSVITAKIKDEAVTLDKINKSGASSGYVIKYNGTSIVWAQDDTGSGGVGDTFIAYWDSVRNKPNNISYFGNYVDWNELASAVQESIQIDNIDTFIAYWDSIRNKPSTISYLGDYIDWSELASAVQESIQNRTDSTDIANWNYEANPLNGAIKYGESDTIRGVLHLKQGGNITLTQTGDTITIAATTQSSTAKSDSLYHGGSYHYGDDFALAETLDNFLTSTDTINYANKAFDSDSLGGHPPSYFLDNTIDTFIAYWDSIRNKPNNISYLGDYIDWNELSSAVKESIQTDEIDTFIAYWDSIRNIPAGFADGIDDTGHYSPPDTFIAYWDSIRNIPNDISNGDDIDTFISYWDSIRNKPSDISYFGNYVDWDELSTAVKESIQIDNFDTFIAYWDSIRNKPSDISYLGQEINWDELSSAVKESIQADDIDTFIAHWDSIRDIPSGFADGVDDTGHFEPKDTFIAHWDSIRNMPSGFADGVDDTGHVIGVKDTMIAYFDSLRGKNNIYWLSMYINEDGDTNWDTVFNQDTLKSEAVDSINITYGIFKHLHGGSNHWEIKHITSSETIDDSTTVYICDASEGAITLTLTEPGDNENRLLVVKKRDNVNNVTIDAGAGYTIDDSQTYSLTTQYQSVILICDGEQWFIIADK